MLTDVNCGVAFSAAAKATTATTKATATSTTTKTRTTNGFVSPQTVFLQKYES